MIDLLDLDPYAPRRDEEFLAEMNSLTESHLRASPQLSRIWREWQPARSVEDLPFLHVGIFKDLDLRSNKQGVRYSRMLESSSTSGSRPSRIPLDIESSELQSRSVSSIIRSFVGNEKRALLIVDSVHSLRVNGTISARMAAAMSLRPIATDIFFLLSVAADPASILLAALHRALEAPGDLMIYGFTSILWQAWRRLAEDTDVLARLARKRITFLHSGGWKKLESISVTRDEFESTLLGAAAPGSSVIDFYGLVEQVGIVYPLCQYGSRHVPVWADVLVRDAFTLQPVTDGSGQLALMNCLARGAPYHTILTEDLGRILPGDCPCGRSGRRFEFLGRIPRAELRGCANV
jgi:hypothetical protein